MKLKIFLTLFALLIVSILGFAGYLWMQIPYNSIVKLKTEYVEKKVSKTKEGQFLIEYNITPKKPKDWVVYKDLDKRIYGAFIVSEDWSFFDHGGVDTAQIKEAVKDHLEAGKNLRGASTISQQLSKNLFLSHERSYLRKLKEVIITLTLEKELPKEKILEIYLNIIEFGEGIYGIHDAAKFYFNKPAKDLTAKEAAFLAMLLPNPKRYAESFRSKELTSYAKSTIASILDRMSKARYITQEERDLEKELPLSFEKAAQIVGPDPVKKAPRKRARPTQKLNEDDGYRIDSELLLDDAPDMSDKFDDSELINVEEEFRIE